MAFYRKRSFVRRGYSGGSYRPRRSSYGARRASPYGGYGLRRTGYRARSGYSRRMYIGGRRY